MKTTIRVDKGILDEAQSLGINVSRACENSLRIIIESLQNANQQIGGRQPSSAPAFSSISNVTVDWTKFNGYLSSKHRPRTVRDRFNYAKRFGHCLTEKNLSELQTLSPDKRGHVLKALSALAKFLGVYPDWKQLVLDYDLKWVGRSRDELIIDRLTKVTDPDEIFNWVKEVKRARPELTDFMDFTAITGLRFDEAVASYNLIISLRAEHKLAGYYNQAKQTLEHYKFKETFLRKTKKAFISFVPEATIEKLAQNPEVTEAMIHKRIERSKLHLRFGDVREAHATFTTKHLKRAEIDFLHGRVSTNVFMRNYFNPALIGDLKERALKATLEIHNKTT